MEVVDRGSGVPVVMLPGIQGRWEWLSPAVDALAEHCRVITFSLGDEPSSGFTLDPARGLENFLQQIEQALDRAKLHDVVLMGVSFAGPIAMEFAARYPHRVRGLMLVSALPVGWQPDARARFYSRAPRLLSPFFLLDAPMRSGPELRRSLPRFSERLRFVQHQAKMLRRCWLSPTRMARRVRWLREFQFSDPASFRGPTLVVTGEADLDRVVRPALTRQYAEALPHARWAVLENTGHLGCVTRPNEFSRLVRTFLDQIAIDEQRASA